MKYKNLLACAASLIVLATSPLGAVIAQAQSADGANDGSDAIIVTARKRGEDVQDVPIPITAVTGETLTARGIGQTSELSRVAPSLLFDVSGLGGNSATIFLRGVGQANFSATQDPKVGVYVDEVYYARPEGTVFDLFDIDHVEVLRGPQGTLFGRNTAAGLVHIVTKDPTDSFSATVRAGVGNQGQVRLDGVLNVPLGDTLAFRASASRVRDDGYVLNTATNRNWNDKNSTSVRASLLWTPSPSFRMKITGDYSESSTSPSLGKCSWTGPSDGSQVSPGNAVPFAAYVFGVYDQIRDNCNSTRPYRSSDNDLGKNHSEIWGISDRIQWDLGFADVVSVSSYRETRVKSASWGLGTDTVGTASYLEAIQDVPSKQHQWSQELRLQGQGFDKRLSWVVGAYFFGEKTKSQSKAYFFRNVGVPTPTESPIFYQPSVIPGFATWGNYALFVQNALSGNRIYNVDNSSWAAFSELTFDVTDRLSLTAGIRYTEDDREFTRGQTLINGTPSMGTCPDGQAPAAGTFCTRKVSYSKTTPRFIASYKVGDSAMLYASWSRGYSSGGFNNGSTLLPYLPELSDNYEAGLKSELFNRRVTFNLSTFYNKYRNQQLSVTRLVNGRPEGQILNAQQVALYGVEGELTADLKNGLEISAQFGLVDGKYDRFLVTDTLANRTPPFTPITALRDLSSTEAVPNSPYTYGISASYTTALGGGSLRSQLGWSYRGRQFNTLEALPSSRQDGFGLLDGRITWTAPGDGTKVSLWGTNLLGKEYFLDAADFSSPVNPLYTVTKYYGQPRRFGIEITHTFGN